MMEGLHSLDALVRTRLRKWPQRPPGLTQTDPTRACWLRGRPSDDSTASFPFLKFPGSNRMRTLPDGLWLNFGGSTTEPYVDVFAIEACGSLQNLLDKRFRFAPSTQSLLAVCPVPWLLSPADQDDPTPRWRRVGVLREAPGLPLVCPIRDIRVMYALRRGQYRSFSETQVPHPHEYFVPMDALVAEHADQDPALRALVARASTRSGFLDVA
jgi:hypothetical protein